METADDMLHEDDPSLPSLLELENRQLKQQLTEILNQRQGVLTLTGIAKYWPQIVALFVVGYFLVQLGREQQSQVSRVEALQESSKVMEQVKAETVKTMGDVRELQNTVSTLVSTVHDQNARVDALTSDVRRLLQLMANKKNGCDALHREP